MSKLTLYSLAIVIMLAFAAPTSAGEIGIDIVFTDDEVSIIRAYYRVQDAPQKGKQKDKMGLPPGIVKNLRRGKSLPPGIAKQTLPEGLVDVLPPPPHGFDRVVLSGKVLLVEVATQVIHDVLKDVIVGN